MWGGSISLARGWWWCAPEFGLILFKTPFLPRGASISGYQTEVIISDVQAVPRANSLYRRSIATSIERPTRQIFDTHAPGAPPSTRWAEGRGRAGGAGLRRSSSFPRAHSQLAFRTTTSAPPVHHPPSCTPVTTHEAGQTRTAAPFLYSRRL